MTPLLNAYLAGYSLACIVAVFLMIRERKKLVLFQGRYGRCLQSPWKLATFVIAASAMTVMAP